MDLDRCLFWDCETRSTVDLRKTGAYVYACHPSTEVTVARFAIGKEAPVEWRPGQPLPDKYRAAFLDPLVEIVAHNAAFERLMLTHILHPRHGWPDIDLDRWICTMARARAQALPGSLDQAANAAGLGVKKDGAGHGLMLRMCRPRSFNPDGTPVWWEDAERMAQLSEYCATDVKVERALYLSTTPLPIPELEVWDQTERMNDRGVCFDLSFVRAARVVAGDTRALLDAEMSQLTGRLVPRASNIDGLKRWLLSRGVDLTPPDLTPPGRGPVADMLGPTQTDIDAAIDLDAEVDDIVEDVLEEEAPSPELRRRDVVRLIADPRVGELETKVLKVRLEAGKVSTKKLEAIIQRADEHGVVRGLLGYHGASTGRYISTGLQVQNFPRDVVRDWESHRRVLDGGADLVDAISGPPLDIISRMLRGAIVPRPGHEIAAGDFSSVEAVGVAWLSGQEDLLQAFHAKRKIYEEMASRIYHRRSVDIKSDSVERFVGKTVILGCGYQMGWRKFRETCLLQGGVLLSETDAQNAVYTYRDIYPQIPKLWRDMQEAAVAAVRHPGTVQKVGDKIRFRMDRTWLRMRLPSLRYLWYAKPLIEKSRYGDDTVTYMGVNAKTRKWERVNTYGGRLTENAVQGLCRDLLVHATIALEAAGYRPVTLVHDEIIAEPPIGHGSIEEMCALMSVVPPWAEGFALSAKGARGVRYQKT